MQMTIRDHSLQLLRQVLQMQDEHGRAVVAAHIAHAIDMLEAELDEDPAAAPKPCGDPKSSMH
ncbi:hypothetical protein [Sphingomonas sp. GC_Shp_4]|uniref:hypothetical protein n=1 Tax=Sphingomonas sp. GC_Shp_4 TaxID=2937382 RepID=UPI00226B4585|nr:hypothetical protein [Sphingomonas sp. GC_Shp_4]